MYGGRAAETCPKCGVVAQFDQISGGQVCTSCGAVLEDVDLVQHVDWNNEGERLGVYVGATDTGVQAGASALGAAVAKLTGATSASMAKLSHRLREVCNYLALPRDSTDQAMHLLGRAAPLVMTPASHWRREHLVAAAAYASARLDRRPLTLVDLSGVMQIDPFTLGRYYRALLALLQLAPPAPTPAELLPRCVQRVLSPGAGEGADPAAAAAVGRDAALLLSWLGRQLLTLQPVMPNIAAAVVLAGEMNRMGLTADHIASALSVGKGTLDARLVRVKKELLRHKHLLPYGDSVGPKNVGSHARTLIRLSDLAAASAGEGGRSGATAAIAIEGDGGAELLKGSEPGGEAQAPAPAAGGDAVATGGVILHAGDSASARLLAQQAAALAADPEAEKRRVRKGRAPKKGRKRTKAEAEAAAEAEREQQQQQGQERGQAAAAEGVEDPEDRLSDLDESDIERYIVRDPAQANARRAAQLAALKAEAAGAAAVVGATGTNGGGVRQEAARQQQQQQVGGG